MPGFYPTSVFGEKGLKLQTYVNSWGWMLCFNSFVDDVHQKITHDYSELRKTDGWIPIFTKDHKKINDSYVCKNMANFVTRYDQLKTEIERLKVDLNELEEPEEI